jgi:hypothetical protein
MNEKTRTVWVTLLVLFLLQIAEATTEYWDTPEECNIDSPREISDRTIVFACSINVNSNLISENVTWLWDMDSNYQYSWNVNNGGRWQSKDDKMMDYVGGYNIQIYFRDGSWVNWSSMDSCDADLYSISVYSGATFYLDDYYGNSRCRDNNFYLFTGSDVTLRDSFIDDIKLYTASTDDIVIYRFFHSGLPHTGNLTVMGNDNSIKWINMKGYYGVIAPRIGSTGTINIIETNGYRVDAVRAQRVNLVNSSFSSYFFIRGNPSEIQLDNSHLDLPFVIDYNEVVRFWTVGDGYSSLGAYYYIRVRESSVADVRGYINFNDNNPLEYDAGKINRTYPICLYVDSYYTPISAGCGISLYNVNDSIKEGLALTDSSGCVNVTVNDLDLNDEFDTLGIRAGGVEVRSIPVFADSTEAVGGHIVGLKVANVTSCSTPSTTTTLPPTTTTTTTTTTLPPTTTTTTTTTTLPPTTTTTTTTTTLPPTTTTTTSTTTTTATTTTTTTETTTTTTTTLPSCELGSQCSACTGWVTIDVSHADCIGSLDGCVRDGNGNEKYDQICCSGVVSEIIVIGA